MHCILEKKSFNSFNFFLILGNKCDAESSREVTFNEASAMSEYLPEIMLVLETSAKENTNVEDAFMFLATELKVRSIFF